MPAFFLKWKDVISGLGTILGVLIGIVGFGTTIYQLSDAKSVLRASNAYNIQRDARDLVKSLQDHNDFRDYVMSFDTRKKYDAPVIERAELQTGRLVNFYLSVFRQAKADGISKDFQTAFAKDFCDTLQSKPIGDYWNKKVNAGTFGAEHGEMRNAWCK